MVGVFLARSPSSMLTPSLSTRRLHRRRSTLGDGLVDDHSLPSQARLATQDPSFPQRRSSDEGRAGYASSLSLILSSLTPSSRSTDKSLAYSFGNLLSQPSVTAGFGLMYRHSLVRIEANVGVPLAMGKQEGGVKGLQFGLGLSFL